MNPHYQEDARPDAPAVIAVSALNQAVARVLERNFPLTWISGEISNFTKAASGHWYFTLKDAAAQVRAVMFRGRAQYADFIPREGDKVEVRALVTLYAPRGDYQLNVEAIRRAGVGNLYEAFLQLKNKLEKEGLFAAERKRALPLFARTIGIVTSPQAAALRDILTTLKRRAPHVRIILYPAPVQGAGAAEKIAAAIRVASARRECDVLLVCRGGGSIEDLWSFNEEVVARAIVACEVPVISGVGHETDFTIADFAADLRAPTPTAAAEMAATAREQWQAHLLAHADALKALMARQLGERGQRLDWLTHRLVSPSAYIARERLRLKNLQAALGHATKTPVHQARFLLERAHARLQRQWPDTRLARHRVQQQQRALSERISQQLQQHRQRLQALESQLSLLDPQRTLERGYAIVHDDKGMLVRHPKQLRPQGSLTLRVAEGSVEVGISAVQERLD